VYLGFLPCVRKNFLAWRASLALLLSVSSILGTSSHLKYRAVMSFPSIRWVISLRRRLLLLPMYMTDFLVLASSYAPFRSGKPSKFVRVNLRHLAFIGIIHLPFMIDANYRLAYPLAKRLEGSTSGNLRNGDANGSGI